MKLKDLKKEGFKEDWKPFKMGIVNEFKFGGVYVIKAVKKNKRKEDEPYIVKVGQTNNIYRRLGNYLDPKLSTKGPNRQTRKAIREALKKTSFEYFVTWKLIDDEKERKKYEKELLDKYKLAHGKLPPLNKISR